MKPKFIVFKVSDVEKYTPHTEKYCLGFQQLNNIAHCIQIGRHGDGKPMCNEYIVINRDEPYANEVIEIMKRHGHWEDEK